MDLEGTTFAQLLKKVRALLDGPVDYFREKCVAPYQEKYPYYHRQFRRVPTIDQCYQNDIICRTEAQFQFQRDKMVDTEILSLLRQRYEDCGWYYDIDKEEYCGEVRQYYKDAIVAWFTKYGDQGVLDDVVHTFMKQKHRMIWERRHGPIGSGITNKKYDF
ncbi:NADH dehydrogenase (ubiquinone) PDSW subunit [Xylocopa sonorina]|uniref:NADH dehydrogenase (ubiquinone) PDSW subunit n=1 Tax=Xylocopa sonorina TaxID=1818115 RepID=UPI00403AB649